MLPLLAKMQTTNGSASVNTLLLDHQHQRNLYCICPLPHPLLRNQHLLHHPHHLHLNPQHPHYLRHRLLSRSLFPQKKTLLPLFQPPRFHRRSLSHLLSVQVLRYQKIKILSPLPLLPHLHQRIIHHLQLPPHLLLVHLLLSHLSLPPRIAALKWYLHIVTNTQLPQSRHPSSSLKRSPLRTQTPLITKKREVRQSPLPKMPARKVGAHHHLHLLLQRTVQ